MTTLVAAPTVPTVLRLVIPGEPVGKERPRFPKITAAMIGQQPRPYTAGKTREYEKRVQLIAQAAMRAIRWTWSDDDRFNVIIRIHRTYDDKGADLDNVQKTVLDALNKLAWKDDAHVWGVGAALGARDRKNPRVEVEIRRIHKSKLLGKDGSR